MAFLGGARNDVKGISRQNVVIHYGLSDEALQAEYDQLDVNDQPSTLAAFRSMKVKALLNSIARGSPIRRYTGAIAQDVSISLQCRFVESNSSQLSGNYGSL